MKAFTISTSINGQDSRYVAAAGNMHAALNIIREKTQAFLAIDTIDTVEFFILSAGSPVYGVGRRKVS